MVDYDDYFYDYTDDSESDDAIDPADVGALLNLGERGHWILVKTCEVISDGLMAFIGRGLACHSLTEVGQQLGTTRERRVLVA